MQHIGRKNPASCFPWIKRDAAFYGDITKKATNSIFLLFVCHRFAPLEQINTLHILTVKIKTMEK